MSSLPTSTLLRQRYEILKPLGEGGMSTIYMVQDIEKPLAMLIVKEFNPAHFPPADRKELQELFKREGLLLKSLCHPRLPKVHDFFDENKKSYIVMDFIQGTTLDEWIEELREINDSRKNNRKICFYYATYLMQQLADIVNYLHTETPPAIHKDIKPKNIIVNDNHEVYLIDFGIAKNFPTKHYNETTQLDQVVFGSPGYAAPEQFCGRSSKKSDIYSIGAILHQIISGLDPTKKPPHKLFEFERLDNLRDDVPEKLADLTEHCLEQNPIIRLESAKYLSVALGKYAYITELRIFLTPTKQPDNLFVPFFGLSIMMLIIIVAEIISLL